MIAVRPATPADAAGMAAVIDPLIEAGGTTAHQRVLGADGVVEVFMSGPLLIACHAALDATGVVAGFQSLERHPALPPDVADIATFARPWDEIPGVGRALTAATVAAARAAGFAAVNATIRADNARGLGFYARMGFEDHSIARAVPLADGTPVDRVSKRLIL